MMELPLPIGDRMEIWWPWGQALGIRGEGQCYRHDSFCCWDSVSPPTFLTGSRAGPEQWSGEALAALTVALSYCNLLEEGSWGTGFACCKGCTRCGLSTAGALGQHFIGDRYMRRPS